jgi:AP endonuclease 2
MDAAEVRALDSEGRCVVTDHGAFVLFNVYCPNTGGSDDRFAFKLSFNRLLQARVARASLCVSLLAAGE